MRVGLSVLTRAGQSLWENGIGQNVVFLADLLKNAPLVEGVCLLDCGDQGALPGDAPAEFRSLPLIPLGSAGDVVDVAIEIAGGLDIEWVRRFRARGGKIVCHICGQPYAALVEFSVFDRSGYWGDPTRADEVWILPKDRAFAPMLRSMHRCPVEIVPYLWAPNVLEDSITKARSEGLEFGYRPGPGGVKSGARIGIFEPNLSPIKTCVISAMICDALNREAGPVVESVNLYNGAHMQGQTTFDFFRHSLSLHDENKIAVHGREYFVRAMSRSCNVVISHQLQCEQNYLYLDALYGDYPLVHNSPLFAHVGYYFEDCDITEGVNQLRRACLTHDENLERYRARARAEMDRLSPHNPANAAAYVRRLIALKSES
ncbi:DUF2827 domain-containing protein [Methylocystis sp. SC2]|uniref:DUF2827 domain-containing protein n=1 Tax=Methylocystis sp. (strain SC2) TaxID=187303 RepID=UPI00027AEB85|nr:DUF2827 domain-containing protein [Methylocystis sp. SC2]CCJ06870.1 Conserved hypothetical protein [Methylocystis sp. SC2]